MLLNLLKATIVLVFTLLAYKKVYGTIRLEPLPDLDALGNKIDSYTGKITYQGFTFLSEKEIDKILSLLKTKSKEINYNNHLFLFKRGVQVWAMPSLHPKYAKSIRNKALLVKSNCPLRISPKRKWSKFGKKLSTSGYFDEKFIFHPYNGKIKRKWSFFTSFRPAPVSFYYNGRLIFQNPSKGNSKDCSEYISYSLSGKTFLPFKQFLSGNRFKNGYYDIHLRWHPLEKKFSEKKLSLLSPPVLTAYWGGRIYYEVSTIRNHRYYGIDQLYREKIVEILRKKYHQNRKFKIFPRTFFLIEGKKLGRPKTIVVTLAGIKKYSRMIPLRKILSKGKVSDGSIPVAVYQNGVLTFQSDLLATLNRLERNDFIHPIFSMNELRKFVKHKGRSFFYKIGPFLLKGKNKYKSLSLKELKELINSINTAKPQYQGYRAYINKLKKIVNNKNFTSNLRRNAEKGYIDQRALYFLKSAKYIFKSLFKTNKDYGDPPFRASQCSQGSNPRYSVSLIPFRTGDLDRQCKLIVDNAVKAGFRKIKLVYPIHYSGGHKSMKCDRTKKKYCSFKQGVDYQFEDAGKITQKELNRCLKYIYSANLELAWVPHLESIRTVNGYGESDWRIDSHIPRGSEFYSKAYGPILNFLKKNKKYVQEKKLKISLGAETEYPFILNTDLPLKKRTLF